MNRLYVIQLMGMGDEIRCSKCNETAENLYAVGESVDKACVQEDGLCADHLMEVLVDCFETHQLMEVNFS